ncbi:MAG: RNA-binding transcriptional accessory protein [Oscillospiraceae bacterium]|nr:RNA-binding transcriptional accessory protein [Oscillospiraceae bacterium]
MEKLISQLSLEFNRAYEQVENVITLIEEGCTIPFIARYRKELHGSMDDELLRNLADRHDYLCNMNTRRNEIISSIDKQGKLTDELIAAIEQATTLAKLEDIYRPYKQKRRTRATVAREKGLEPLAAAIFAHEVKTTLEELAAEYIDIEKGVETVEDALRGASDIIAEDISDNAEIRGLLRTAVMERGTLNSTATRDEDSVYRLYYDFKETLPRLQSHRILAINRAEKEKYLKVSIQIDNEAALRIIYSKLGLSSRSATGGSPQKAQVQPASELLQTKQTSSRSDGGGSPQFVANSAKDSYERLLFPSIEREARTALTDTASEQAIKMFALNLKPTLMQPPVKNMVTMGFDPAYRTGCKIAVVDETGKLLETGVVYPTAPHNKTEQAAITLTSMIKRHKVKAIAIGNGTASKESEIFIADMLKGLNGVSYMMVNEAGASVYSASKLATTEFPDLDVSLRSAVSIARRLQDPLAELVKIDPKSIGVGQYQHDMPAARLDSALGDVVEDCVNAVGVDMNTASPALLSYVSGLNSTTANNIVAYREENGVFTSRSQIKKVPKIGKKAFEQCAGFLRIPESKNVLDNTGVHPESYKAAEKILEICGSSLKDVTGTGVVKDLNDKIKEVGMSKVAEFSGVGTPTVIDIINELKKPGRDPRDELPPTMLRTDVMDIKDLASGMVMKGTVRNVIDFGAFVDIGVHQDGLVHVSELANRFVKHPSEVVKVGDIVDVRVVSVDEGKKRISLSMKEI